MGLTEKVQMCFFTFAVFFPPCSPVTAGQAVKAGQAGRLGDFGLVGGGVLSVVAHRSEGRTHRVLITPTHGVD